MITLLRAAAGLSVLLLVGCAAWAGGSPEEELTPPVVELSNGSARFELEPWSACISDTSRGACWDGSPENPVDIGAVAAQVEVASPLQDWRWEAVAREPSAPPGTEEGSRTVAVEHSDDGRRLALTIPPGGPFAVDLAGRGTGGDATYTFIVGGNG